jgi:hypothetical protein
MDRGNLLQFLKETLFNLASSLPKGRYEETMTPFLIQDKMGNMDLTVKEKGTSRQLYIISNI